MLGPRMNRKTIELIRSLIQCLLTVSLVVGVRVQRCHVYHPVWVARVQEQWLVLPVAEDKKEERKKDEEEEEEEEEEECGRGVRERERWRMWGKSDGEDWRV